MSKVWELGPDRLQIHDALYEAGIRDIEEVLSGVPAEIRDLAIFGHNPTFTRYASLFLERPLDTLPTAGVLVVSLDSESWGDIGWKNVKETYLDYPKRK
jgi:phosphohistidine phosphatase